MNLEKAEGSELVGAVVPEGAGKREGRWRW